MPNNYFDGCKDKAAVKRRYRELAAQLHPDTAAGDRKRQAELEEKMKVLNAQYMLAKEYGSDWATTSDMDWDEWLAHWAGSMDSAIVSENAMITVALCTGGKLATFVTMDLKHVAHIEVTPEEKADLRSRAKRFKDGMEIRLSVIEFAGYYSRRLQQ